MDRFMWAEYQLLWPSLSKGLQREIKNSIWTVVTDAIWMR